MTRLLRSNLLSQVVAATTSRSAPVPRIGTLRLVRSAHLTFSLIIAATGSHVPHVSQMYVHATSLPDAIRPEHRLPPNLSRAYDTHSVLTSSKASFRKVISGSLTLVSIHHT